MNGDVNELLIFVLDFGKKKSTTKSKGFLFIIKIHNPSYRKPITALNTDVIFCFKVQWRDSTILFWHHDLVNKIKLNTWQNSGGWHSGAERPDLRRTFPIGCSTNPPVTYQRRRPTPTPAAAVAAAAAAAAPASRPPWPSIDPKRPRFHSFIHSFHWIIITVHHWLDHWYITWLFDRSRFHRRKRIISFWPFPFHHVMEIHADFSFCFS